MKKGYRSKVLLAAWVSVLFLQLQVVKPDEISYRTASSGDIKSISYPQNYAYPIEYSHEWQIRAPTGYRIRLKFRDFNLGAVCLSNGYILEVWNGIKFLELCGKRMPPTIESSGNKMGLYLYSQEDHRKIRFWAYYERFVENEVKTENPTKIYPTLKPELNTGDQDSDDSGMSYDTQRLYLLMSMMGCVLLLVIVTIYCGCTKRRQRRSQRPTPTNVPNDADLENEDGIWGLDFGDPPPSYDEVTRQSIPDVSSITQNPSRESTTTDNEGIDSSGLPSYREALRLSQQSLDANV